jgi:hypothetical protein
MKIIEAFYQTRRAFLAAGLQPPEAIHLKDAREAALFERRVRSEMEPAAAIADRRQETVVTIGGEEFWQAELLGIKVRWPARRYALPGGGWTHV